MILGINWYNRRASYALKSKQWRETAILLWSIYSTWLFDPMRLMGADLIRRFFDFLDYSIFSNVIVYDRHSTLASVNNTPVLFAMNHPGLDERLLVQWLSRTCCSGRHAVAASNSIDPKSGKEYSADYMRFMLLKGITSRRLMAVRTSARTALEAPLPGRLNDSAFCEMVSLLGDGTNIIFAPEGETNPWPSLKPFKSGIARLGLQAARSLRSAMRIVPVAVHSVATGHYSRHVIVEIGEAVNINGQMLTTASSSDKSHNTGLYRGLMSAVESQLRAMCDIIPYSVDPSSPAPHHNGRSDLEMKDPFLQLLLLHQDVIAGFSSALQEFASDASEDGNLLLPGIALHTLGSEFQNASGHSHILSGVVTSPRSVAVIWRLEYTRFVCRRIFGENSNKTLLGDQWDDLKLLYIQLKDAVRNISFCPQFMECSPVEFCRNMFITRRRGICCCFPESYDADTVVLRQLYSSFVQLSVKIYVTKLSDDCSMKR